MRPPTWHARVSELQRAWDESVKRQQCLPLRWPNAPCGSPGGGQQQQHRCGPPPQALSNQKLFETRRRFGHGRCGLQTGDASLNTDGDIVIMTTEILRNIMYRTAELAEENNTGCGRCGARCPAALQHLLTCMSAGGRPERRRLGGCTYACVQDGVPGWLTHMDMCALHE